MAARDATILDALRSCSLTPSTDHERSLALLSELRVIGRNPPKAEVLYTPSGIRTVLKFGLVRSSNADVRVSREALRCLANAFLLAPLLRAEVIDEETLKGFLEIYRSGNVEDEFLGGRIIFLLTYDQSLKVDVKRLVVGAGLGPAINKHTNQYRVQLLDDSKLTLEAKAAHIETLKVLYNILHFHPELSTQLHESIAAICTILCSGKVVLLSTEVPTKHLINVLINIDFSQNSFQKLLFPPANPKNLTSALIKVLDSSLPSRATSESYQAILPLLTVLQNAANSAPAIVISEMRGSLLPDTVDRDLPLGQSSSLASRLLRISNLPTEPVLGNLILSMMYALSDSDAGNFVQNIGYGNAAGYLTSHNISAPASVNGIEASDSIGSVFVNPITGQRLDKELPDTGLEMTDEEKEWEAERLFVLFERLRATGVVNVDNPVRQAVERGDLHNRVEEVDDAD